MEHIGVNSIPLVFIIAVFTGGVAAGSRLSIESLAHYLFLVRNKQINYYRVSPVLTAIVIAGRAGASLHGTCSMKVTEQIDALETMGISPVSFLAT